MGMWQLHMLDVIVNESFKDHCKKAVQQILGDDIDDTVYAFPSIPNKNS